MSTSRSNLPPDAASKDQPASTSAGADAAVIRDWRTVYSFWFPEGLVEASHPEIIEMVRWWMGGGATAELSPFLPTVAAARAGALDDWRDDASGRLTLIVILDQFTRGLFRNTPEAFSSDMQSLDLAVRGLENGHYHSLSHVWEKAFFLLPLVHAEGADHLERLRTVEQLHEQSLAGAPEHLKKISEFGLQQVRGNIEVIGRFGRFPHRNAILGRPTTREEAVYLDRGDFVHERRPRL